MILWWLILVIIVILIIVVVIMIIIVVIIIIICHMRIVVTPIRIGIVITRIIGICITIRCFNCWDNSKKCRTKKKTKNSRKNEIFRHYLKGIVSKGIHGCTL